MDKEKTAKGEWSLAELYTDYDDPRFAADTAEMDSLIQKLDEQSRDLSGEPKEALPRLLKTREQLTELIGKAVRPPWTSSAPSSAARQRRRRGSISISPVLRIWRS